MYVQRWTRLYTGSWWGHCNHSASAAELPVITRPRNDHGWLHFKTLYVDTRRSQWPSGLRWAFAADRFVGIRVRIPPGTWMSVSCECCAFSDRVLCDEPIIRPEESYRLWCVTVYDLEPTRMTQPWPALGCSAKTKNVDILLTMKFSIKFASCRSASILRNTKSQKS